PSAIQQCTIIPMINGRNVVAQAFKLGGKTTTLGLSVLQVIDTNLHKAQALVLAQSKQAATEFRDTLLNLTRVENASSWVKCYLCDENAPIEVDLSGLAIERGDHIILGTPAHILELIRRRLLQTRHFKILAVDNLEQVVESGFDAHILDVRRCLPCPLQTVVTFTTSSPELIRTTNDLMTDPIHISVNDNSVFFYARHFFLVLPATANRLTCIFNLRQRLKANRIVIFTRESEAMQASGL
ncbi:P-loop containing nucleoside triphosphate hydrolase protein, partial [Rhizoctonia solani]